jgi:hypothetical protein
MSDVFYQQMQKDFLDDMGFEEKLGFLLDREMVIKGNCSQGTTT